jgi:transcriptional regulator with XRE-family HTH domain
MKSKKEKKATPETTMEKIGKRLQAIRKEKGYKNYEHLAYELEMGRSQYWKYEAGGNIEMKTLLRILAHLNVTVGEFFKDIDS